uniref:Uncharacterized protein n=1 Tax=Panagrellus redivivus TaxID=6233 RepID=A0A7E4V6X1_PANRE
MAEWSLSCEEAQIPKTFGKTEPSSIGAEIDKAKKTRPEPDVSLRRRRLSLKTPCGVNANGPECHAEVYLERNIHRATFSCYKLASNRKLPTPAAGKTRPHSPLRTASVDENEPPSNTSSEKLAQDERQPKTAKGKRATVTKFRRHRISCTNVIYASYCFTSGLYRNAE